MKAAGAGAVTAAAAFVLLTGLAACSSSNLLGSSPEPRETPALAAAPAALTPPPVDLAGRWQLSAAAGGACSMNFAGTPGTGAAQSPAPQGTIAPAGGCPGNFFMSRKWALENGMLIIRDFKGRTLTQMSYVGAHFEGHDASDSALTLSKQQ
jgi:hypothetical protein